MSPSEQKRCILMHLIDFLFLSFSRKNIDSQHIKCFVGIQFKIKYCRRTDTNCFSHSRNKHTHTHMLEAYCRTKLISLISNQYSENTEIPNLTHTPHLAYVPCFLFFIKPFLEMLCFKHVF